MLKKGIISNVVGNSAEAFIPEENNVVTPILPFANSIDATAVNVGDNCVIALFDTETINLANGVIIAIY